MSINSSSIADNSSLDPIPECFRYKASFYFISFFSIIYVFLLPPIILVLYLGFQQWRKQCSISTTATSHSDLLTYHSITMQLNEFFGYSFVLCGFIYRPAVMAVGLGIYSATSLGQALFHVLTCVDCYLAVVHPVTYLSLKQSSGVRIRNITIGCVWLLSFGYVPVSYLCSYDFNLIMFYCLMFSFLTAISFCCISVLCTLKRPGPGEVGGNRERVDQSKQRAFHIILTVMGALLFSFTGNLLCSALYSSLVLQNMCVVFMSSLCFNTPSRFVLPLLFLRRAGKLQCCQQNPESG